MKINIILKLNRVIKKYETKDMNNLGKNDITIKNNKRKNLKDMNVVQINNNF